MRFMRRFMLVLLLAALLMPVGGTVRAQDDNPNPAIVLCVTGAGCWHSEKSGEITGDQMAELLGENETGGNTVLCTVSDGCQWSAPDPDDLDLLFEGDGEADGDKQPAPDLPDDADSDLIFPELDVEDARIVPVAGTWTGYNLAGAMVCPGVMTLEIPASPPQSSDLIVVDGGVTLTLESNDPELGVVPMRRVQDGVYHGVLEMTVDGQTMTIDYDEVFVAPTLAFGMIHGEMTAQGMTCTFNRPFYTIVEGLELLEAPVEDDASKDDSTEDDPASENEAGEDDLPEY